MFLSNPIETSSTFAINSSTGYIILTNSLDRETESSYTLRVIVSNVTFSYLKPKAQTVVHN